VPRHDIRPQRLPIHSKFLSLPKGAPDLSDGSSLHSNFTSFNHLSLRFNDTWVITYSTSLSFLSFDASLTQANFSVYLSNPKSIGLP
jgi:hypothetical protein